MRGATVQRREEQAMQPALPAAVQVWMKRRVDDGVTTTDRAKERADCDGDDGMVHGRLRRGGCEAVRE